MQSTDLFCRLLTGRKMAGWSRLRESQLGVFCTNSCFSLHKAGGEGGGGTAWEMVEPALGCPEPRETSSLNHCHRMARPSYDAKEPSPKQQAPTDTQTLPRHPP